MTQKHEKCRAVWFDLVDESWSVWFDLVSFGFIRLPMEEETQTAWNYSFKHYVWSNLIWFRLVWFG